ncbi:MAG TPA: hypothetical protein PLQ11_11690, partial [Beijerinckiaceae bacterium]|nr:hypothetical protein [Beijerinckiaceae bacterium]
MLGAVIAVLPIMAAGAVVIGTSRDLNEVAFAMLAVAGMLSLAGIGLLWTLRNAQGQLEARSTETRHLVLALTRSMRHLAQRVGGLEASTQAVARLPDWMPGAANIPAPAPPVLIERRLLTVPQRRLAGIEIVAEWGEPGNDAISAGYRQMGAEGDVIERIEAAVALAGRPLLPENAFILVSIDQPLAGMSLAIEAILALTVARPPVAARLVIGISQRALRLGGNS